MQLFPSKSQQEGTPEELANLTYPFGRGVNLSFGIEDVPKLYQKVMEANYPIYRTLTKREFRVGEQYIYPHEFAVLDPDGYFLRFSEQNNKDWEKIFKVRKRHIVRCLKT